MTGVQTCALPIWKKLERFIETKNKKQIISRAQKWPELYFKPSKVPSLSNTLSNNINATSLPRNVLLDPEDISFYVLTVPREPSESHEPYRQYEPYMLDRSHSLNLNDGSNLSQFSGNEIGSLLGNDSCSNIEDSQ